MIKRKNIERVFLKAEDEDFENFVCNFCYVSFTTKTERDTHIDTHLLRQICDKCNKSVILIGSRFYEQHGDTNCKDITNNCDNGKCELTSFVQALEPTNELVLRECSGDFTKNPIRVLQSDIKYKSCSTIDTLKKENVTDDSLNNSTIVKTKVKSKKKRKSLPSVSNLVELVESDATRVPKNRVDAIIKSEKIEKVVKQSETDLNETSVRTNVKKKERISNKLPKPLACSLCDKSYAVFRSLITHQKKSHSILPTYQCHVCSVVCKTSCYLKNHIDTHYTKKYICSYCGRGFNLLFNLREHVYDHTGERPYICETCGKTFKRTTLKRNHMRQHTGERPFKCDIDLCERNFAYSTDLRRHKRGAHGILTKPFECLICGRIFYEKKYLRNHMQKHAGGDK